jgi:DNA-binding CsgD family transcriptional regulator
VSALATKKSADGNAKAGAQCEPERETPRSDADRGADTSADRHAKTHPPLLHEATILLSRAAALHDEALALREGAGDRVGMAESLEALAGLAMTSGADDKAARLFGAARVLREATGSVRSGLHAATYDADLARLSKRMDSHDLECACAEGAAMPVGEAVWHARRGRGRRNRPGRGWEALTPAQRRVAELVAQGLSNAEVAAQLFVGPETVKTHLAGVLAKLGMSSRWELRGAPHFSAETED